MDSPLRNDMAEEAQIMCDERTKLYAWLVGPGQDHWWKVLPGGTEAEKTSCFVVCAKEVFGGTDSSKTLREGYDRDFETFQQIYALFRTRSDMLHLELPDAQSERLKIYGELLLKARDSGTDISGSVDSEVIDLWHRNGWYAIFHERELVCTLTSELGEIFRDKARYRQLLRCDKGDDNTQKVLDLFQELLDHPQLKASFRQHLIVATLRISAKSGLYPTCYELKNIVLEGDVFNSTRYSDIRRGTFEQQTVCLKVIRFFQNEDKAKFLKKLSREAILWGQLSHPNILPIYGLFRIERRFCLVSPWMGKGDIAKYLLEHPKGPRIQLAADVSQGLFYLHKNGIVHGDLKGLNILINDAGRACLGDFGLSSVTDPEILAWASQSSGSSKGGTIRWQAPELLGTDSVVKNTQASDIYACACIFYEIFAGKVPFGDILNEVLVLKSILTGVLPSRPPKPSDSWDEWGLTENIWSLMEECWKAAPDSRPSIDKVLAVLLSEVRVSQGSAGHGVYPPAHFRRRMQKPLDPMSLYELGVYLGPSLSKNSTIEEELTADEAMDVDKELGLETGMLLANSENMTLNTVSITTGSTNKRKFIEANESLLPFREGVRNSALRGTGNGPKGVAPASAFAKGPQKTSARGKGGAGRLTRTWGP